MNFYDCLLGKVSSVLQIVLAGDPLQLGPVLRSKFAKQFGLELSFLERLIGMPLYERNEDMFADHGSYDPLLVSCTNTLQPLYKHMTYKNNNRAYFMNLEVRFIK